MTEHPAAQALLPSGTDVDQATAPPVLPGNLAQLIRWLVATAEEAGIPVHAADDGEAEWLAPAPSALTRLVRGTSEPGDEQLLAMPTKGSRLLVIRASTPAALHRQVAVL